MARKKKQNKYSMVNGIRMTKDGKYEAAVFVGRSTTEFDKNGKPKPLYEWVRGETYNECKEAKRKLEELVKSKKYTSVRNMLFEEYAPKWLELNRNSVAHSTFYKNYKMYVNSHFIPFFGKIKIKDIDEFLVKEYIAKKLEKLSPTTVRKHFFVLNKMLYDALKDNNPCKDIEPPAEAEYIPYVPTQEEFNRLLAAVKGMYDEPIILLAGKCGLREGEIFHLKSDDLNDEEESIRVDEALSLGEDGYATKGPKSKRGYRTIAVNSELYKMLKNISNIKKAKANKVIDISSKKPEAVLLFDEMRPDSYSKRFAKIIKYHNEMFDIRKKFGEEALQHFLKYHGRNSIYKQINLQNKKLAVCTFHSLRHFHTTEMYENNIPDQYAAERLGDDIKTMKAVYQHLRLQKKQEIDAIVKNL